jgi:hypothetical protein
MNNPPDGKIPSLKFPIQNQSESGIETVNVVLSAWRIIRDPIDLLAQTPRKGKICGGMRLEVEVLALEFERRGGRGLEKERWWWFGMVGSERRCSRRLFRLRKMCIWREGGGLRMFG